MIIDKYFDEINDLERSIRDHINTHRYQKELLKNSGNWNQICSSLDAIGDATQAIKSYVNGEFPEDTGLKYIYVYGVFQAMFIQQDALRHLCEAFDIVFELSEKLKNIRNNRNAAIGHPTKQHHKGVLYNNYISRMSISKRGFKILRHSDIRPYESVTVDFIEAIQDQLLSMIDGYININEKLTIMDNDYKDKFKNSPLLNIFPSSMGYHFEKIGQGIYDRCSYDFGLANLKILKNVYIEFRSALSDRNHLNDYQAYDLSEYFHAVARLEDYFSKNQFGMTEVDARIYHTYLSDRHDCFVSIATEIDSEYL